MAAAARRRGRRPRAGADLLRRRGLVLLGRDPGGALDSRRGPAGARHRGPGRRRRLSHLARDLGSPRADPSRHLGPALGGRLQGRGFPGPGTGPGRAGVHPAGGDPAAGRRGSAVEGYAFPADPALAAGRPAREVTYPSPLGPAAAWRVGAAATPVILIHGYNAARTETLQDAGHGQPLRRPGAGHHLPQRPGRTRSPDGLRRWGRPSGATWRRRPGTRSTRGRAAWSWPASAWAARW